MYFPKLLQRITSIKWSQFVIHNFSERRADLPARQEFYFIFFAVAKKENRVVLGLFLLALKEVYFQYITG